MFINVIVNYIEYFVFLWVIIVFFGIVGNIVIIVKILYDFKFYILIFVVIGFLVLVDFFLIVSFIVLSVVNMIFFDLDMFNFDYIIIVCECFDIFYLSFIGYVLLFFCVRYFIIVYFFYSR